MPTPSISKSIHYSLLFLLGLLLSLPKAAPADSLGSIPDPTYSQLSSSALSGPIAGPIDRIVYPTLGFPSIVTHRDTVTVLYRLPSQTQPHFKIVLTRTTGAVRNQVTLPIQSVHYDPSWKGYRILALIPPNTPVDMYDLKVSTGISGITDQQPNSVRVLSHIPSTFRFIHLADSQHGDHRGTERPGNLNDGGYGPTEIFDQELEEIRLLDPAFCVLSGDLLYGFDYEEEYNGAHALWKKAGFPVFMVPGNHDGYATRRNYTLGRFNIRKVDGLEYWRRYFGPLYYSFDIGKYHFVALNSYDGTTSRRESIYAFAMNYGGHLGPDQLAWLQRDLSAATAAGKQSILFMHHNPQGNISATRSKRYIPSKPFSLSNISPVVLKYLRTGKNPRSGQVWNEESSAQTFMNLIAKNSVSHVLLGHVHRDRMSRVGNVEFIETTTLSSSAGTYWGYRLFEISKGNVRHIDYEPTNKRQSIPAGNLKVTSFSPNDGSRHRVSQSVSNALSTPIEAKLSFHLRWNSAGYQTSAGRIIQTTRVGNRAIVHVRVTCPPGQSLSLPSRTEVEVSTKKSSKRPGCAAAQITPYPGPGSRGGNGAPLFFFWFLGVPFLIWTHGRQKFAPIRFRT
ncbi:MAG: metallophosphoesterase [Planctomycetota bacterium]|jgi:3',5'-cyclic AMP phosphodiesterase CpdA|nr:metallophosphoesterase [Planctomycetota bacterium]